MENVVEEDERETLWTGFCFFFNDTATTEIYTLSLHDALPIFAISGFESQKCGKEIGP